MLRFNVITAIPPRKIFIGNDVTVAFPLPFKFYDASSLVVTLIEADGANVVKTIITDYTVSGGNGETGTVTATSFTPETGEFLVVENQEPSAQGTDYLNNDNFEAETMEARLDRVTMIVQHLLDVSGRSPRLNLLQDPDAPLEPSLPVPVANELLAGKSDGSGWEGQSATALGGLIGPTGATGPTGPTGPQGPAGATAAWTYGTLNTATGGTILNLVTDFPSGVTEIEVDILTLAVSGVEHIVLQIGPTGGLETSGYEGGCAFITGGEGHLANFIGFNLNTASVALEGYSGKVQLALVNAATNLWSCKSTIKRPDSGDVYVQYGYLALSGGIEKLSILTSGTDTFVENVGTQVRYR